jgi:hypothetical protein
MTGMAACVIGGANGGSLVVVNAVYLQIIIGGPMLAAVFFDQWQGRRAATAGAGR